MYSKDVPRAKRSEVVGWERGALRVRVTALPHEGAANRAVIDLLATTLGVSRSSVALVKGATSRDINAMGAEIAKQIADVARSRGAAPK